MPNITIKIDGFCASGGHIYITVTENGTTSKQITIHKSDLLNIRESDFMSEEDEWNNKVITLLSNFVKESGLTDWTQIKTELEKKVFKL